MAEWCAVVGIGQTKHGARRGDVSIAGLVREAAMRALEDADMTWRDIEAVVIGKAPDMFEGVMMPELYLADALGAVGKPIIRVHTAGLAFAVCAADCRRCRRLLRAARPRLRPSLRRARSHRHAGRSQG